MVTLVASMSMRISGRISEMSAPTRSATLPVADRTPTAPRIALVNSLLVERPRERGSAVESLT